MRQCIITFQGDTVLIEPTEKENKERHSAQLTYEQFCVFMQSPNLTRNELIEQVWAVYDKTQGRAKCIEMVDKVLYLLRGDGE